MFPSPALHVLDKVKITLFLARLKEIQAIGMKIRDVITSRLLLIFPEISGKFTTLLTTIQNRRF